MISTIREFFANRAEREAERRHARIFTTQHQLEWLRATMSSDHQWLGHNPVADGLCKRYRAMLSEDWPGYAVEDISGLRERLGLSPHKRHCAPAKTTPNWIDGVIQQVAELPDRDSPEDQPEMMLVTADELREILEEQLAAPAAEPAAWSLVDNTGAILDITIYEECAEQWRKRWRNHEVRPLYAPPQGTGK